MECGELIYEQCFQLLLKWTVHKSYVMIEIMYGCLCENKICILQTERSMLRSVCGLQLKNSIGVMDLMQIFWLNGSIELVMANYVFWCGYVFWRDDSSDLRRALEFEVEYQMMPKRAWKKTSKGQSFDFCRSSRIADINHVNTRLSESGHPNMLEILTDL